MWGKGRRKGSRRKGSSGLDHVEGEGHDRELCMCVVQHVLDMHASTRIALRKMTSRCGRVR
jgi:hypothetical protein